MTRSPVGLRECRRALTLVAASALAFAACSTQPLITPSPIASNLGAGQNRLAVLRGMAVHRWALVAEEPGRITARFDKKDAGVYVATVDILYGTGAIEIRYRDSNGLDCKPVDGSCSTIHRAYNRWVVQLARDIEYGVQTVRAESTPMPPVGKEGD